MCLGGGFGLVPACDSCKQEQMERVFEKFWEGFKSAEGTGEGRKCISNPVATACVWEKKDGWTKYEYEDKIRATNVVSFSKQISFDLLSTVSLGRSNFNISFSKTWPQPVNGCKRSSFALGFLDENGQSVVDDLDVTCEDTIRGGVYVKRDLGTLEVIESWAMLEALKNIKSALKMITGEDIPVQVSVPIGWGFTVLKNIEEITY